MNLYTVNYSNLNFKIIYLIKFDLNNSVEMRIVSLIKFNAIIEQ